MNAALLAQVHWNNNPLYFSEEDRYRALPWLYEAAEFRRHAGERVLEIGCGSGCDLLQFAKHGAIVTGVDIAERHLDLARVRLGGLAAVQYASACHLPTSPWTDKKSVPMSEVNNQFRLQVILARPTFGLVFVLALAAVALCPVPAYATVRDVTQPPYNAVGDGVHDDTSAINAAISALQPGDTLLFPSPSPPCTTYRTYLITSQLTINVIGVTVDGSGCAIIKDQYSGQFQGEVMVIGGNGSGAPNLGSAVALSATANELDTSVTTFSNLGVSPGDYVYLCQGGVGGDNGGTSAVCGATSMTVTCDPSGCRGEVLKVNSVSGNTVTVTTALHDTYIPGNAAQAQRISSPLVGITIQNIAFDGTASNVYGLVLAGVAESTVSDVTSRNVQGAAMWSTGAFNVSWSNITVTGAGSAQCGGSVFFQSQGNLSVNGMTISNENPGQGTGCLANGAFGLEYIGSADGTITNLSVDATGAYGRPFKTTAARWNTFNSPTITNTNLPISSPTITASQSNTTRRIILSTVAR